MDGVLKLNTTPIKEGQDALIYLQQNKIPFIIVTNASGELQTLVNNKINKILKQNIQQEQVVSASCPVIQIINNLQKEDKILIFGAKGFSVPFFSQFTDKQDQIYFADDIAYYNSDIVPIYRIYDEEMIKPATNKNQQIPSHFDYIIFYCDSVNWYSDIQIAVSVIQQNPNVKFIVTNPDKTFATKLGPKLTIGSEVECICTLSGYQKDKIQFLGKPYQTIFQLAKQKAQKEYNLSDNTKFIMIGDQISGDIVGGNRAGCETVLVKTGKDKSIEGKQGDEIPTYIFDDVYQAVKQLYQNNSSNQQ